MRLSQALSDAEQVTNLLESERVHPSLDCMNHVLAIQQRPSWSQLLRSRDPEDSTGMSRPYH
jgi:hypothetical protein